MITTYDYYIIGAYLVFILTIGVVFRRLSRNTSDYFRAGGAMPWWLTGTSAWIAGFSAWTFTGAALMVYETGTLVLCLYYSSVVAYVVIFSWTCVRFRRMRVVAWMEAVRLRYGAVSEQFYTWVKLPLLLFLSGISLNAIGVFVSSVFPIIPMNSMLVVLGGVITLVAFAGGAWAVLASDFVQMFLVMTITIVAAVLTLRLPQIGGIGGLVRQVHVPLLPSHWGMVARPFTLALWALAISWMQMANGSNMENSTMYLMAKSDRDARRMVLIPMIGSLVGPIVWIIPALAATIIYPDPALGHQFVNLKNPHEAAFVAVCLKVMPKGMLGLLLSAMLGATLTSMDAGLNKGVGVFIRSFYLPLIDPNCPEKRLLVLSKACTLMFGCCVIGFALLINTFRTVDLFTFVNQMAASLTIPLALPLFFGLFYKKTPGWSAWSTGLVGFGVSLLINCWLKYHWSRWTGPLTAREADNVLLAATTFGTLFVGAGWFFFTSLFYDSSPAADRQRVEEFWTRLRTPVTEPKGDDVQESIYRLLGKLCIVYGCFILLLTIIPNSFRDRLCFVFCGGTIFGAGGILYLISRRMHARLQQSADALGRISGLKAEAAASPPMMR